MGSSNIPLSNYFASSGLGTPIFGQNPPFSPKRDISFRCKYKTRILSSQFLICSS